MLILINIGCHDLSCESITVGSAKNKFNKSVDVYQAKYRGYLDKEILVYFTEEFTEVEKIVTWEEVD